MKASAKVSATRASAVRDVTRDGESSDVLIPSLGFSATQRVPSRRCGHAGDGDVDDARRVDARADAVEPGVARNDCLTPKPKLNGKCTLRECCNFVMDVDDIRCYGTKPSSRVHPRVGPLPQAGGLPPDSAGSSAGGGSGSGSGAAAPGSSSSGGSGAAGSAAVAGCTHGHRDPWSAVVHRKHGQRRSDRKLRFGPSSNPVQLTGLVRPNLGPGRGVMGSVRPHSAKCRHDSAQTSLIVSPEPRPASPRGLR